MIRQENYEDVIVCGMNLNDLTDTELSRLQRLLDNDVPEEEISYHMIRDIDYAELMGENKESLIHWLEDVPSYYLKLMLVKCLEDNKKEAFSIVTELKRTDKEIRDNNE